MTINDLWKCTRLKVWNPKWSEKHAHYGEPVALLHKRKVDFASPTIIVEFTKSPSLSGQRFAIKKEFAQKHEITTNGSASMYAVPMSHFESYETPEEVAKIAESIFN